MPQLNQYIRPTDRLVGNELFHPDDMLTSGGDIAFAGVVLGGDYKTPRAFASSLLSLANILTRIVLSERLIFLNGSNWESEPPTAFILKEMEKYCSYLFIDETHPVIVDLHKSICDTPRNCFGDILISEMHACVGKFAPWTIADTDLSEAWLVEYGIAAGLRLPFAPNPVVSKTLGLHEARAQGSDELLLRYVEYLRDGHSQEYNRLRGLDIFDLKIPAIFSTILRESQVSNDLVRIAAQMQQDARAFREWSRDLDSKGAKDWAEQYKSAQASLDRLGRIINSDGADRLEVTASVPGLAVNLPSPTLEKLKNLMDVNWSFRKPRRFLLNVLASIDEVRSLSSEFSRVFKVTPEFAEQTALLFVSEWAHGGRNST